LLVKQMPSRRSPVLGQACRPRFSTPAPSTPRPTMASGGAPALGRSPSNSSTILRGPWRRGSQTVGPASTSRAVLSSRRTNWTRASYPPRGGWTWVSLPQRPTIFGLVPLSQKARAHHGPVDGDDGLLTRLCGPRVPHPQCPQGPRSDLSGPKRQAHPEPDRTLGVPLLRGDSCALHPATRTPGAQSDRRAPAPAPTPGKAVCVVLSIKMHPNQALCAEWRLYRPSTWKLVVSRWRNCGVSPNRVAAVAAMRL